MRLFVQLYLTFVGIIVLIVVSVGVLAVTFGDDRRAEEAAALAELWVADLPTDPELKEERFERLSELLHSAVTLRSPQGDLIAGADAVPMGEPGHFRASWGHGYRVVLSDGRLLGVYVRHDARRHVRLLVLFALIGVLGIAGCWPVARRLSRRLERLRAGAERWGDGDLNARVQVHGTDEVAQVGRAFNLAADKVQALVQAQNRVLANASHELRSPLARLRIALAMVGEGPLIEGAIQEVEELDAIVGDVLRAARMQSLTEPHEPVDIDLRGLLDTFAGEDVVVSGPQLLVRGDPRLMRRMVSNLVDNARRYGEAPILLEVTLVGIAVQDGGAALPEEQRERLFEPFYRRDGHSEGVHGGVGLGLALVKQIAELHGGQIRYSSADGHSRFVVDLPKPR